MAGVLVSSWKAQLVSYLSGNANYTCNCKTNILDHKIIMLVIRLKNHTFKTVRLSTAHLLTNILNTITGNGQYCLYLQHTIIILTGYRWNEIYTSKWHLQTLNHTGLKWEAFLWYYKTHMSIAWLESSKTAWGAWQISISCFWWYFTTGYWLSIWWLPWICRECDRGLLKKNKYHVSIGKCTGYLYVHVYGWLTSLIQKYDNFYYCLVRHDATKFLLLLIGVINKVSTRHKCTGLLLEMIIEQLLGMGLVYMITYCRST